MRAAPVAAQGARAATGVPAKPAEGLAAVGGDEAEALAPAGVAGRLVLVGADDLAGADGFSAAPVAAHTEPAAARPVRELLAAPAPLP
jgi:hypothetical protein